MTNQECKNTALAALKGNWAPAVLATIVYFLVAVVLSGSAEVPFIATTASQALPWIEGVSFVLIILVIAPLAVGYANACRFLVDSNDREMTANMFSIPLKNYLHIMWGYLLMTIKIFLWSLLFLIPGIIKSFSYAMAPYILVEEPELSASQAIKKSKEMMKGHKFDFFYLYLSFIGWFFLSLLTCCIGFFWLEPYAQCSFVAFYNDLKAQKAVSAVAEN